MKRTRTTTPSADSKRIRTTSSYQHGGINYSDLYRKIMSNIIVPLTDLEWEKILDYLNIIKVRTSLPLSPEATLNNNTILASFSREWVPDEDNALAAKFIDKINTKAELQNKTDVSKLAKEKRNQFVYQELKHHSSPEVANEILARLPYYYYLFDILEPETKLGEGTHGTVFKVKRKPENGGSSLNTVAKTARPYQSEFLINEIRVLTYLQTKRGTPYIVSFFGLHLGPNHSLSLLTKFTPNGDLFSLIETENISTEDKIKITKQLALAVAYLHIMSCVHLDIKPENVLISYDNMGICIKLTDFGLSLISETEFTAPHVHGTSEHLAPEILEQDKNSIVKYTKKADVFSFFSTIFSLYTFIARACAITCQEVLPTGESKSEHLLKKFYEHLNIDRVMIHMITPVIPVLVDLLINTGKRNPDERPCMADVITMMNLYDEKTGVKKALPSYAPPPSTNASSSTPRPN